MNASSHDLILRGARVIDPSQNIDRVTDVRFTDGRVAAIGDALQGGATTEIRDLKGKIVTPGPRGRPTSRAFANTSSNRRCRCVSCR
jgi:predicted amidohydrolase